MLNFGLLNRTKSGPSAPKLSIYTTGNIPTAQLEVGVLHNFVIPLTSHAELTITSIVPSKGTLKAPTPPTVLTNGGHVDLSIDYTPINNEGGNIQVAITGTENGQTVSRNIHIPYLVPADVHITIENNGKQIIDNGLVITND